MSGLNSDGDLIANLIDYLKVQDRDVFRKLFKSPATCLAIHRMLPPIARHLIMSNLFTTEVLSLDKFTSGFQPYYTSHVHSAISKAKDLHIFQLVKENTSEQESSGVKNSISLKMSNTFRVHLQQALYGSEVRDNFGRQSLKPDKYVMTIDKLDQFCEDRRQIILHFMVGTVTKEAPSDRVKRLLEKSGLMNAGAHGDTRLKITNRGFQFLLKDKSSQIWIFLLQYLILVGGDENHRVEVLNFYFLLGSLELGCDYSMESLTETQKDLVRDLQDYGVVYLRKQASRRFYPTRLATTLFTGVQATQEASLSKPINSEADTSVAFETKEGGEIIVETNYRVYAYTTSPLQIAILNLFISLKARFSNMVEGYLDRESIRRALGYGITAEQIINYLETHAHPQMLKNNPVIPITVVDQIRLWELEKDRVRSSTGHLWSGFSRTQDFDILFKFAREIKAVIWASQAKRLMVLTRRGHEKVSAKAKTLNLAEDETRSRSGTTR